MRRLLFLTAIACLLMLCAPALPQAQAPTASPDDQSAAYAKAIQARDWPGAVAAAQQLVQTRPTADNLRLLGNAQVNAGAMNDALGTFDRALTAAQAEKPAEGQPDAAWKRLASEIHLGRGNAYLKLRRNSDAIASYTRATEVDPGFETPYFNICAMYGNAGDMDNGIPACRRAVEVNPANPNGWFLLGTLLFGTAKLDAQRNFAITPECRQALNKYLELAPSGPHAADVKAMLEMSAK